MSRGFIKSQHGLRQGDPLSPALFILVGEYSSRGLNELFASSPKLYFDTKKGLTVSHLAYVDDLIVFTKENKEGLRKVMTFFKHYESCTGQKMNMEKSNVSEGKNANTIMIQYLTSFGLK